MVARPPVVVVGLVTRDLLVLVEATGGAAEVHAGYGGVLHAVSACAGHGVPVVLVSCLDELATAAVSSSVGALGPIDLSCVVHDPGPLPRCALFWAPDATEPVEQTVTNGTSIPHQHLLDVAGRQAVPHLYVNMTTGHDVGRRTLEQAVGRGSRLYFDPHMLLYQMDAVGARYLNPPDDWREWLAAADVLQLNSVEFGALCSLAGLPVEPFADTAVELLQQLRSLGSAPPRLWALIRTTGHRVDVVYESGGRWCHGTRSVEVVPVPHTAYTIGCGDVFGAGVFSRLVESWDSEGLEAGLAVGIRWARESARVLGLCLTQGGAT